MIFKRQVFHFLPLFLAVILAGCDDGKLYPFEESTDLDDTETESETDTSNATDDDEWVDTDSADDVGPDEDRYTDTSMEKREGDSLPCPLNSGYPCACDREEESCDDGSRCWMSSNSQKGLGLCTLECRGLMSNECRKMAQGFGLPPEAPVNSAECLIDIDTDPPPESDEIPTTLDWQEWLRFGVDYAGGLPDHCLLICGGQGFRGACPEGLECQEVFPLRGMLVCLPEMRLWINSPNSDDDASSK